MTHQFAAVRAPARAIPQTATLEAAHPATPGHLDFVRQVGADLVASSLIPESLEPSFGTAVKARREQISEFLRTHLHGQVRERLHPHSLEDLFIPEAREHMRLRAQQERIAQEYGVVGSEEYKTCFVALGRNVLEISVPNPEESLFPRPRPATEDRVEQERLLRLMGLVGVEQLAATGRSDLLGLYMDNVSMLIMEDAPFDGSRVLLSEVLERSASVFAFAEAFSTQERNARFRDRTGRMLKSESSVAERAERLWPLRRMSSILILHQQHLALRDTTDVTCDDVHPRRETPVVESAM